MVAGLNELVFAIQLAVRERLGTQESRGRLGHHQGGLPQAGGRLAGGRPEGRGADLAQDDYYYEIQLTNKQLVFYFMAGATGLILSFLAGVMVGRGVEGTAMGAVEARPVTEERVVAEEAPAPGPGDAGARRLELRPAARVRQARRGPRAVARREPGAHAARPRPQRAPASPAALPPVPTPAADDERRPPPRPGAAHDDAAHDARPRRAPAAPRPAAEAAAARPRPASRSRWARSRTGRAPTPS